MCLRPSMLQPLSLHALVPIGVRTCKALRLLLMTVPQVP